MKEEDDKCGVISIASDRSCQTVVLSIGFIGILTQRCDRVYRCERANGYDVGNVYDKARCCDRARLYGWGPLRHLLPVSSGLICMT